MEGQKVWLCEDSFLLGESDKQHVGLFPDSSPLLKLEDPQPLRDTLQKQGYLFLKNAIPREVILQARQVAVDKLKKRDLIQPLEKTGGKLVVTGKSGGLYDYEEICKSQSVKRVLEGPELTQIFETLLGGAVRTYDTKWLRGVPPGGFTGPHMDAVYMGRGTPKVLTCWVPFDDVPIENGPLAICEGSHADPGFERVRATYGKLDVDKDNVSGDGWFSKSPKEVLKFGGKWRTANFNAGDIVLFTLHTFHCSLKNTSNQFRITCDIRWQLQSEDIDPRWIGEKPIGHTKYGKKGSNDISMEEAKKQWGLVSP
eukprot:TRINITY_DN1859_c0_g1_i1.p1 TRINITY_DN1859_c0_g1~~TRINITY_DN1859_c0_g1_i1.p1  ORF type:complete len:312 (-),score=62.06 TRINITY_DN1859_c0_g1_i1:227-1162(-)